MDVIIAEEVTGVTGHVKLRVAIPVALVRG